MITLCREKGFKFSDGDPGEYKVEHSLHDEEIKDETLESGKKINDSDETKSWKKTKINPKKPVGVVKS
jgi:hypothetical protein